MLLVCYIYKAEMQYFLAQQDIWVARLFFEVEDKWDGYLTYLPSCLASLEVQDKQINVYII